MKQEENKMKNSRRTMIVVLVVMMVCMLFPTGAFASTKTTKVDLSKDAQFFAGDKLDGINANVRVIWNNRILPISDKVTVEIPYCSVEKTQVSVTLVSNNGKKYVASKTFPSGSTKARVVVTGANFYNTKSLKVVIKGTRLDTGATSTWTIINK